MTIADFFNIHITDKEYSILENLTTSDNSTQNVTSMYLDEAELYHNASNTSFQADDWRTTYKPILDFTLLFGLVIMLLAMGCEIELKNLLYHLRRPIGLGVGMVSQFGIMPLSAFCILLISGIQGLHATAVLIVSCSPGGGLSNTFTYFSGGDIALSVAMTTASTLVAMGMMPLNVWMYGRHFQTDDIVVPYKKMAFSLVTLTLPVIFGMFVKCKLPRIAPLGAKVGSLISICIVFMNLGIEIALFPNMITGISLKLYVVILTLPVIGLTLGYLLASLLKQSQPVRKTIAIECGVQNVPLALTVITLSFSLKVQERIVLLPWLYAMSTIIGCLILCLTNYFWKRYSRKAGHMSQTDTIAKQNLIEGDAENIEPSYRVEIKCDDTAKNGIQIHGTGPSCENYPKF